MATWIPCLTPAESTALCEFLNAEGHYASWMVRDRDGLVVLTTAPASAVKLGLAVVGRV